MQTTFRPVRHGARGFALILTLVFLLVSLIIFGSIMYWVSSNAKVSIRNNQFTMSENAAEAGVERILAQMDRDFLNQSLDTNNNYYSFLPSQTNWPVGYQYSDTNGTANQISVWVGPTATNTQALNSQFSGLYGFAQNCTITATATPASATGASSNWVYAVPATVSESLQFASIPIFQFAIFYNMNLEICPGHPMTITGPVFCNQSIWEGSEFTTFSSTVSAVGTNDTTKANPFAQNYAPQNGGPTFNLAGQPLANANALTMPIAGATNSSPTNVEAIINMPKSPYAMGTSGAYTTNGQIYLANAVDIYITNTPTGTYGAFPGGTTAAQKTNTFAYFQDSSALTLITPDYYVITNANALATYTTNYINPGLLGVKTNVWFAGYSFASNALFVDWREGGGGGSAKTVQAVSIDVRLFNKWLTNSLPGVINTGSGLNTTKVSHSGHNIDSIYVFNAIPQTSTTLPAVRVNDGAQLPTTPNAPLHSGLTIVTPMPLYVQGNYNVQRDNSGNQSLTTNNTTYTYPAAFMADAITILSTAWQDGTVTIDPGAAATTVNAACLEGIVQSNPAISGNYSGGVENFLRLLESWGNPSPALTYNGSIVVMFPSQYATNSWGDCSYYDVPARNWAFDANFRSQSGLPPLTPQTKAIVRGNWLAY